MVALALILSYVERLIPVPMPVPGIKLGLANLVTIIALYLMSTRDALIVSVLRVIIMGALFGSGFSTIYALCGALCAWAAMAALKRGDMFHIITVSAMGGVCHNIAQLAVAQFITRTPALILYMPILAISGLVTGVIIGTASQTMLTRLKKAIQPLS